MGAPLKDADHFEIGPAPAGSELLVRLDLESHRYGTALFRLPRLTEQQRVQLEASMDGNAVVAKLALDDGRSIGAESIQLPLEYRG